MAGIKDTAVSTRRSARKPALGPWPLALGESKKAKPKTKKTSRKTAESKHKKRTRKTKARGKKAAVSPVLLEKPIEFPQVKGKTVEEVKLYLHDDDTSISMYFADKTHLNFALEPRLTVRTSLADFTTGDWSGMKTWPAMMSESSYIDD